MSASSSSVSSNAAAPLNIVRRCGAKRSPPGQRTAKAYFRRIAKADKALPVKIDWRPILCTVRDQGDNSTCVAFTSACVKESMNNIGMLAEGKLNKIVLSPQFIYDNRPDSTSDGMFGSEAMKILLNQGICSEQTYPYRSNGRFNNDSNIKSRITEDASKEAAANRIKSFAAVTTLDDLKVALTNGCCYTAFPCYNSTTTFWQPQSSDEPLDCGHAVTFVGYDDEKKHLIVRNSWGSDWGDGGYTYMPYSDFGRQWEVFAIVNSSCLDPVEIATTPSAPKACCVIQ